MIVIISAQNPSLDSSVDNRFGRSPWLVRLDTATNQWEAFQNPGASQSGGAGVAAAQFSIDQHAHAVISGDFGPHAASALRAGKVEMRLFAQDVVTVQQAADRLASGELSLFA
jgi:predicted Fe-Mo cluster-binding NifX family protein